MNKFKSLNLLIILTLCAALVAACGTNTQTSAAPDEVVKEEANQEHTMEEEGMSHDADSEMQHEEGEMEGEMDHDMDGEGIPDGLDTATMRASDGGAYMVSINSDTEKVPVNEIHSWTLHVATSDGTPVDEAEIVIDGGMPQHGHGLPTEPQVTENLGDGDYLVEGLKFQMAGWWEVKFNINADGNEDSVTFNLILE